MYYVALTPEKLKPQFLKWESCLQSGEPIGCLPFMRFLILGTFLNYVDPQFPYQSSKDSGISTLIA